MDAILDILMEVLVEVLGTAIVEGGVSAASNRRRPAWQRVLVLAVLALFCAGVFAVLLLVGIYALPDLPLISLFLFALDAVWLFLCVRKLRKILRTFSRK